MYSTTMIHDVKDVKLYDGLYTDMGRVKSTRDILITLANGETVKIMCFMAKGDGNV
jgi:hypothetical protein